MEVSHDDKGMIWPKALAPYAVHVLPLVDKDIAQTKIIFDKAEKLYCDLQAKGIEVLLDDRREVSAGVKFADSDLLGIPLRLVISAKTLAQDSVEVKHRQSQEVHIVKLSHACEYALQ